MTTASLVPSTTDTPLMRRALLSNVAFSTTSGIALLVAARPIGNLLGSVPPWLLSAIGAGLLLFALRVFLVARGLPESAALVPQIIAGDLAWVAGSLIVLLWRPAGLTSGGLLAIADVALIVAAFALFQFLGLRRLGA